MSISRLKRAAFAAAAVVIAGCTADSRSPLGPPDEVQPVIADGSRGGPVAGFYFLPPMLKQPVYSGTFDGALSPRVQICELSGAACGALIAEFTMAGGTGGERVTVSPTAQQYQVNWHTDRFDLDPAKHYRISVSAGAIVLGYADVDVVNSGKELKNVNTGEYIALVDGRTLPVKFRIETAIAATVDVSPDSAQVEPGQTQAFTATVSDLHGNPLPSATVTWSSSDAAVATIDAAGVATGVAAGTATVTARSGAASGSATLRVAVSNTAPVAGADAYQAIGNVTIPVAAPGVLANDADAEGGSPSAVPGSYATAAGGTVTLAADGSFTYRGAAGFTGEDSFTYTATDGSLTSEATVTVTVPTRVWFVRNDAGVPGDGRDASPFATLKQVEGTAAPGETLLVFAGNGTTAGYDEGIVLKPGQSLTGQGVAADVAVVVNGQTVVLLPAGAAPSLGRASAGATIRLATDNTVQGVAVSSSQGTGIEGLSFGTLTAGRVSVAASGGPALDLQNGVAAASFTSLSSGGSAGAGLRLVNVGGSLSAPGGSLGGAATAAVEIVGGDAAIAYGGGVSAAVGRSVSITGRTGGSVTLSGSLHDTALGIRVENNAGGTVAFTGAAKTLATGVNDAVTLAGNGGSSVLFAGGGLAVTTAAGDGFSATGGGTVQVTGAGNTLASVGGTALRVSGTAIGAAGLTFRSISATGGPGGIVLEGTGTLNGLQVTGDGASDVSDPTRGPTTAGAAGAVTPGSGGTLTGTSGPAVRLDGVTQVVLRNLAILNNGAGLNSGGDGIDARAVAGLTLDNVRISGHAGNHGIDGSGVSDLVVLHSQVSDNATTAGVEGPDVWNVHLDELSGTGVIQHSVFANSRENVFGVVDGAAVLELSVANSEFRDTFTGVPGNHGLAVFASGGARVSLRVTGSAFLRNRGSGVFYAGSGGAGGGLVSVRGSTFEGNTLDVNLLHQSPGRRQDFEVVGNRMRQSAGGLSNSVTVTLGSASSAGTVFSGTVSGNLIGTDAVANSGSSVGIGIDVSASGAGTLTALVTGNTVRQIRQDAAFRAISSGHTGRLNVTATGNDFRVNTASGMALAGIDLTAGALPGDTGTLCANLSGNVAAVGDPFWTGISLQTASGTPTVELQGYAGAANDDTAIKAFLNSTAALVSPAPEVFLGAGTVRAATSPCAQP